MFNLNPKEDKFYKMLFEVAENVKASAIKLRVSVENLKEKEVSAKEIAELEHNGDVMVRRFIEELNKSFITPIDREDLYLIIKTIDDILDLIDSAMHRFIMFNVDESTDETLVLCDMIVKLTDELLVLMGSMKQIGRANDITDRVLNIKKIEREADVLYRDTISKLFKNEKDILHIMKWREIYEILENTIDSCNKVANIVEGVVVKHA